MKRFSFIGIGILVVTLLVAPSASARNPISSHYVGKVLERVDAGLLDIRQSIPYGSLGSAYPFWRSQATSAMLELLDTKLLIREQARALRTASPCLHADVELIEQKIGDIGEELEIALQEHNALSIPRLRDLLQFSKQRYANLLTGARNPHHIDLGYERRYLFDLDTWCVPDPNSQATCTLMDVESCKAANGAMFGTIDACEQAGYLKPATLPNEPLMCPFDSRYLPITELNGVQYGCRHEILEAAMGLDVDPLLFLEKEALRILLEERDAFLDNSANLQNGEEYIAPDYSVRIGCNEEDGLVHQPPPDPSSVVDFPMGALKMEEKGPFAVEPNNLGILEEYGRLHLEQGLNRRMAPGTEKPSDFPKGSTDFSEATEREGRLDLLKKFVREPVRTFFRAWNVEQAQMDLTTRVYGIDSELEIADALSEFRSAVSEFGWLTSRHDQGIGKFTTKFAFYLLRSCVYRPCQKQLVRVLKMNLEDSCFPHFTREYLFDPLYPLRCEMDAGVGPLL